MLAARRQNACRTRMMDRENVCLSSFRQIRCLQGGLCAFLDSAGEPCILALPPGKKTALPVLRGAPLRGDY